MLWKDVSNPNQFVAERNVELIQIYWCLCWYWLIWMQNPLILLQCCPCMNISVVWFTTFPRFLLHSLVSWIVKDREQCPQYVLWINLKSSDAAFPVLRNTCTSVLSGLKFALMKLKWRIPKDSSLSKSSTICGGDHFMINCAKWLSNQSIIFFG